MVCEKRAEPHRKGLQVTVSSKPGVQSMSLRRAGREGAVREPKLLTAGVRGVRMRVEQQENGGHVRSHIADYLVLLWRHLLTRAGTLYRTPGDAPKEIQVLLPATRCSAALQQWPCSPPHDCPGSGRGACPGAERAALLLVRAPEATNGGKARWSCFWTRPWPSLHRRRALIPILFAKQSP